MRIPQTLALIPLLLIMSCSGGTSPSYTGPYVYLMSGVTGNWQLFSYPANDTGNATAADTITASTDTNAYGVALSSDGNGNLYTMTDVPGGSNFAVSEYSTTNGALSLRRAFTGLAAQTGAFVADKSGVVYMAQPSGLVASFAANASGTAAITQTYPVVPSSSIEGLAEDASGNIYVGFSSSGGAQTIEEFPAGFSSLTPIKTIALSNYLTSLASLAIDGNGTLYAAGTAVLGLFGNRSTQVDAVFAFDNGSLTPTRTLSSANGNNVIGSVLNSVAVDSSNLLYVYSYICPSTCSNTVAIFSATETGDVAPLNYFQTSGPLPSLQSMGIH